ncbi:hypothetical protein [Candidatus Villigracilis affinis]|uniref:hypothetical protein n=1 Tax=Candidatus Villigracilis affinis TaxID=3140682 RepID=UPI002A1FBE68|nr:hypothetical protein [Anaerolineales bacterium]
MCKGILNRPGELSGDDTALNGVWNVAPIAQNALCARRSTSAHNRNYEPPMSAHWSAM